MLFLPAALCWLCSALVAMAAELIQDQLSKTTRADATISLKCTGTNQCDKKQVYWYQQKEGDSLQTILRVDLNDGTVNKRYGHSQRDDFEAMITADLVIKQVKFEHAATYYCSCYKSGLHSEKRSLQPEQKPFRCHRAGNRSSDLHLSPLSHTLSCRHDLQLLHNMLPDSFVKPFILIFFPNKRGGIIMVNHELSVALNIFSRAVVSNLFSSVTPFMHILKCHGHPDPPCAGTMLV